MNVEQTDALEQRARVHAALADVTRLRIVDLLSVGDASATEVGGVLDISSNLLAHHLKVLERANLVVRRRSEGDARRWYLSLTQRTPSVVDPSTLPSPRRVLFVCTANTARSHLAVALWRRASAVDAMSAGTHPGERVNPDAIRAAERAGLSLPDIAPRQLDSVLREGDLVITVCDRAHEELGSLGWAHWSIPDPVPGGTSESFDAACADLAARVETLAPRLATAS